LQGQGGCWMKQWLLNRRIFKSSSDNFFSRPAGLNRC
jgi:hypothetical protein